MVKGKGPPPLPHLSRSAEGGGRTSPRANLQYNAFYSFVSMHHEGISKPQTFMRLCICALVHLHPMWISVLNYRPSCWIVSAELEFVFYFEAIVESVVHLLLTECRRNESRRVHVLYQFEVRKKGASSLKIELSCALWKNPHFLTTSATDLKRSVWPENSMRFNFRGNITTYIRTCMRWVTEATIGNGRCRFLWKTSISTTHWASEYFFERYRNCPHVWAIKIRCGSKWRQVGGGIHVPRPAFS